MKSIIRNLRFTKNETKVLVFIIAVFVVGFGLKYFNEVLCNPDSQYDYSESDKIFLEKSRLLLNDSLTENDSSLTYEERKLIDSLEALDDSLKAKEYDTDKKIAKDKLTLHSININTASKEKLATLSGIGDKISDRIIKYREEHGGFKKIEEIMNVKGIGKKKFEKMKVYITVK
jgi:comEA protein